MAKITLDVVTPNGVVFNDMVDSVFVEGIDGDLGILPGHIPLFTAIKIGILTYKKENVTDYLAVMGGFIDINDNKVTVLSSSGEKASDIDALRVKQDKDKAEQELMMKKGDVDFAHAEKEIVKSAARLKAMELLEQSGRGRKKH
jgi:F-type H+-transporting ATPase subunit epsilon